MRRSISVMLKLTLISSMLTVVLLECDSQEGGNLADSDPSLSQHSVSFYPEIGLSKHNPPIELTMVRETGEDLEELLRHLPGETLEHNRWTRLYEEVLGIRITYDWTAAGSMYRQKFGVSMASGQLPDVIRVNAEQLRQLSNAGLIQDLSEVYDTYATPLTKRILLEEGSFPFDAATMDGKLMGIPETVSSIEGAMFLWIRSDWLTKFGLKPPQTMEDVLMISKAFTERDPDHNGLHDSYGLALADYLWSPVVGIKGFMAGYGAYPNIWVEDGNGRLVFGGIQPEVKQALLALQAMYRQEQLDAEFAWKDGNKAKSLIAQGKIGMMYGEQWGSFFVQPSREADPQADWRAYPIVSVSGEAPKIPLMQQTGHFYAVKKDYPHPEAIVKLFNLHLEKNWGKTAEYDTYYSTPYPAWQLSPVTPYPPKKNLTAYLELEQYRRSGDNNNLNGEARAIQDKLDQYYSSGGGSSTGWGWERTYGPGGAFSILDQYEQNGQLLYDLYAGPITEAMIERQEMLSNLQHEAYINIILGDPIEEFDQFVEEWNNLGGERMTREVNQWYEGNKRS